MPIFTPSDLEIYFLNEIEPWGSAADYATYRQQLQWTMLNRRVANSAGEPNDGGTVGDNTSFSDYDSINSASGQSIKYLRGLYGLTGVSGSNHNQDFLIDNEAAELASKPKWQYTWIAVHNTNTTDTCFRFAMKEAQGAAGFAAQYINQSDASFGTRWIGLIDPSVTTLASLLTDASNFPHNYTINGSTWDAMGSACTVKHGYNNSQSYSLLANHKPWQAVRWANVADGQNNVPNRSQHCFDIPPNRILLGIRTISRDSIYDKEGDAASVFSDMGGAYGSKESQFDFEFDYLVIS